MLIGHSLAGYLSACYAERTHLAKNLASLVLASPVGIGSWRPEHAECETEKASRLSDLEQRFGTDCSELKHNVTPYSFIPTDVPWDELSLSMRVAATIAKHFIVKMWEKRFSIHDTVKPFPSFMCQPIVGWIFGSRFKDNGQWKHPHEGFSRQNVAVYLHEIFRLPASGDYALPVMMEPGPYARRPLEMRIPKFASTVPIAFIYGDIDWMDRDGTNRLMQKFPNVKCHACEKSGHTLYMDNPSEFAKCVRKALEQVEMDAQSASINTKQRDLEAARIGDTSAAA
jgi:pimeloyl-ACP methyl ester carboxylesterase